MRGLRHNDPLPRFVLVQLAPGALRCGVGNRVCPTKTASWLAVFMHYWNLRGKARQVYRGRCNRRGSGWKPRGLTSTNDVRHGYDEKGGMLSRGWCHRFIGIDHRVAHLIKVRAQLRSFQDIAPRGVSGLAK